MSKTYIIDANIVLRLFIDDGSEQHLTMKSLAQKLKQGLVEFYLEVPVAMEVCFVLNKYYGLDKPRIARLLSDFILSKGIKSEKEILLQVLEFYSGKNVDFVDAYLAVRSSVSGPNILTWDKDFTKLNCQHFTPEEIAM